MAVVGWLVRWENRGVLVLETELPNNLRTQRPTNSTTNLCPRIGSLSIVRLPLMIAAWLLAASITAQAPTGSYRMPDGTSARWEINDNHALVWNGQPYIPAGMTVDGSATEIGKLSAAGIKDALIDLPASGANWSDAFAALNGAGMQFLMRINSLAPMAQGIAIEPQGYRVPAITTARKVTMNLAGATSALAILADQRGGAIMRQQRVPVVNGLFSYEVPDVNGLEHVLIVYPETTSLVQPDFWEKLDGHRDMLLASLRRHHPGAGLRGIVNPMGRLMRLPTSEGRFVPTSQFFRDELRARLEAKYRSVETASRQWVIRANDLETFDGIARLVPLWSGTRGVPHLWDPATDRIYESDSKRSLAWKDINDTILIATTRRFKRLSESIRAVTDVPVIQEWSGWAPPYDGDQISIDGIGMRSRGVSPLAIVQSVSRATSSILRWKRPGWLLATDVEIPDGVEPQRVPSILNVLSDIGARGAFLRDISNSAALTFGPREAAEFGPVPLFFPENATNPAMPQRLPGGRWWLPSPASGERIDFGSKFAAYRMRGDTDSYIALWSLAGKQRVILRLVDPKLPTYETIDGSDPQPKQVKRGVEITVSEVPTLIRSGNDIPVPDGALEEVVAEFAWVLEKFGRGLIEEPHYFREAANSFERNPGASYLAILAVMNQVRHKVAPYTWIEAESSKTHDFSHIVAEPGSSMRAVLEIDTPLDSGRHFAQFLVPVRSTDEQQLWIAGRIPADVRERVIVRIGGQTLTIEGEPVSGYGKGFAWHRLGTTRLSGAAAMEMRIETPVPVGETLAIDAIVLYPGDFRPRGAFMPPVPGIGPTTNK